MGNLSMGDPYSADRKESELVGINRLVLEDTARICGENIESIKRRKTEEEYFPEMPYK